MNSTAPTRPEPTSSGSALPGGRSLRRVITTAVICGVAVGTVAAVAWATRSDAGHDTTITERVDTLELDVAAGGVDVIGSDRDDIAIEWQERTWMFGDATLTHHVTGSTLHVVGECGGLNVFGGCATDVVVRVPAGVDVVAQSDAGAVTVAGIDGTTEAQSSAGRVHIEDQSGDLVAHSDAGPVTVDGLMANRATVTSAAGGVTIDVAAPVTELVADSAAGTVQITVPDDGQAYAVEASTDTGSTTIDVPTDPSSNRTIRATSDAGSVTVTTP